MSRERYIRSFGAASFGAYQDVIMGMVSAALPEYGVSSLTLLFRLDAMPQIRPGGSVDEMHPLLAVADYGVTPARDLLAIGVSPSGRVMASNVGGDVIQSSINAVGVGAWHELSVWYDYGISAWGDLVLDGVVLSSGEAGTVVAPLLPVFFARMIAFNGAAAETRCACSIGDASCYWQGSAGNLVVAWNFDSSGTRLEANSGTWPGGGLFDGGLALGWYDPAPNVSPWGAVPATDPRMAYARGVQTLFTRRTRAATPFWRRNVVWLS